MKITPEIRILAELFWEFHNARLKDPSINEMEPYIQPIIEYAEDKCANSLKAISYYFALPIEDLEAAV